MQEKVIAAGCFIFPCSGKKPLCKWREESARRPVATLSYGIDCEKSGLVVFDADRRDIAVNWYREKPKTPWMVKTPRGGVHFYYNGHSGNRQCDGFDVRGAGGYVVGVGSRVRGKVYNLIGEITRELPEWQDEWLPSAARIAAVQRECHDVYKWVMEIESIQGEKGNAGLVRFVSACRDHGVSQAQCMLWLLEWNGSGKVIPPWSEKELERAVTNLYGGERCSRENRQGRLNANSA